MRGEKDPKNFEIFQQKLRSAVSITAISMWDIDFGC